MTNVAYINAILAAGLIPPPPVWNPQPSGLTGILSPLRINVIQAYLGNNGNGVQVTIASGVLPAGWKFDGVFLSYDGVSGNASAVTMQFNASTRGGSVLSNTFQVQGHPLSSSVKFTPGYYVIPNQRPNTPATFSTTQGAINDMDGAFVSTTKRFVGCQVEPCWYHLETAAGGHYYFDPADANYTASNPIDATLAALATTSAARGVDYKLLIFLPVFESLGSIGSTPQSAPYSGGGLSSTSIAPDYIINAGYCFINADSVPQTKLWIPAAMTAFINLCNALGRVYDSNPHVEMIIPIYETGTNANNITDPTYSVANWTAQVARLQAALATAWPTTQKCLFTNFGTIVGSSVMTTGQLDTLVTTWIPNVTAGSNNGFCMGGPDILYQAAIGQPSPGDQISRGLIGSQNYLGNVGLLWEEQANAFSWTSQTAAGTIGYGISPLAMTHCAIADIANGEGSNTQAYFSVFVSYLQSTNFAIGSTTRPASYS